MSGYVALRRDRLRSFATLQTKPGGERGIGPALPDRCATASGVPSPLPLVATSNPRVLISTLWSPLQRLRLEVAEREGLVRLCRIAARPPPASHLRSRWSLRRTQGFSSPLSGRPFSDCVSKWRRERDSNPRNLSAQWFSRPPHSTALPSLLKPRPKF